MTSAPSLPPARLDPHAWIITQAQIELYGKAAGADDPIHMDPVAAKETPLGGTIAQGMLVLAVMGEYVAARIASPAVWIAGGELDVRFRRPVRPGDRLTIHATKADQASNGAAGAATYEIWCENQHGDHVVAGQAHIPLDGFR
ncbi:MaoC family dehydratase [Oceanibacterium hippocampi]|uniref:Bifunctional enoyl-CoA hydratase/phosphate acetyltransferase n=1 Tax=Oceanibacterium hippocampi TaxID=745714 RepID=A0A1Y5TPX5_9PROT|nr:MaoC family dehydratase [Oceanibacterium hippocampi]SLN65376.1 bifunctional enoyl-CoA hydratase/phosphate acetyltransferase [Oceanibacterium hippocampi]